MKIYKLKYTNEDYGESSTSYYRKREDAVKKMDDEAAAYINDHKGYSEKRIDRYPNAGVIRVMWWDEYEELWEEECSWYIKEIEVK